MPALSPAHAAFGDALRELRKERGIAQEGMALKSGLNRARHPAAIADQRRVRGSRRPQTPANGQQRLL
jgi:transcriptional regulator with XRE-family HTH domain